MRCIQSGTCKLNEIFHELDCAQLGRSCGPNMELGVIDTRPSRKSKSWKCVMQCQCAYGYIETNNRCTEIAKNEVNSSSKYFSFYHIYIYIAIKLRSIVIFRKRG